MNYDEDSEADVLVARPPRPSNVSESIYRWGSLLVALGLLAYAGLFISQ